MLSKGQVRGFCRRSKADTATNTTALGVSHYDTRLNPTGDMANVEKACEVDVNTYL